MAPHLRAIDGVKYDDETFKDAPEADTTALGILPGSANPIGGSA